MFSHDTQIRICYADTDQMGYVYYGNYPKFFEIGRVESLRSKGMTYKDMEKSGVMMPVSKMELKYIKPIFYDELITVRTILVSVEGARINFDFEVMNEKGKLCTLGSVQLVFVDMKTGRPCDAPEEFQKLFPSFFEN